MRRRAFLAKAAALASVTAMSPVARGQERSTDVRGQVIDLARRFFLFPASVEPALVAAQMQDPTAPADGAIDRFLAALGTSHTVRYRFGEVAYFENMDIYRPTGPRALTSVFPPSGEVVYPSIGIGPEVIGGRVFATAVYPGGPAEAAGLHAGDELVAIDGTPLKPRQPFRLSTGAEVSLDIRRRRDGPVERLATSAISMQPTKAFARAVKESAKVIEREGRRLGYVRMWTYSPDPVRAALDEVLSTPPIAEADGLVLDLRCRWGGAPPEAVNQFLGRAPEVIITYRDGNTRRFAGAWRKPLVALIDHHTRSGAEILAFNLQQGGVPLVGSRTAGAVLSGRAFLLEDDSLLLLAVQDISVNGTRLEGVGVQPQHRIDQDFAFARGQDLPAEAAWSHLLRRIAHGQPRPA